MLTDNATECLLLFILGAIVADMVMRHVERAHVGMDQRLYDREFKGIVENYV